jgi:hypothetical protein
VLLVNRDLANAHSVQVVFNGTGGAAYFNANVTQTVFGKAQYSWVVNGAKSHPQPDGPAVSSTQPGGAAAVYTLPAASLNVVVGTVSGP